LPFIQSAVVYKLLVGKTIFFCNCYWC